jgi:hypothetical protein
MKKLLSQYDEWIVVYLGISREWVDSHKVLLHILANKKYYYSIKRDKNRMLDGLNLRDKYERATGEIVCSPFGYGGASVLEVLAALAERCEDDLMYDGQEYKPYMWFYVMLKNLKIDSYVDDLMLVNSEEAGVINPQLRDRVEKILDKWLSRRFEYDGTGSPFPLKMAKFDQRSQELWSQMNTFCLENWG